MQYFTINETQKVYLVPSRCVYVCVEGGGANRERERDRKEKDSNTHIAIGMEENKKEWGHILLRKTKRFSQDKNNKICILLIKEQKIYIAMTKQAALVFSLSVEKRGKGAREREGKGRTERVFLKKREREGERKGMEGGRQGENEK